MRFSDVSEVFGRFGGFRTFSDVFGRFGGFRRFSEVFECFRRFWADLGLFQIFGTAEVPSIAELRTILGQEPFPPSLIGSLSGRQ